MGGIINFIQSNDQGLEKKLYIKGIFNDKFIFDKTPSDLINILNQYNNLDEKNRKTLNGLNELDNPVLMLVKFK